MSVEFETLRNLGAALYIHSQLEKTAERAKQAVDYFDSVALFGDKEGHTKQAYLTYPFWGNGMSKQAFFGPISAGVVGGVRAGDLSEAEREELERKYDVKGGANIVARNIGRGIIGGGIGSLLGAALGGAAGVRAARKALKKSPLHKHMLDNLLKRKKKYTKDDYLRMAEKGIIGGYLGSLLGGGLGTYIATNKYSKDNARKSINKRIAREVYGASY